MSKPKSSLTVACTAHLLEFHFDFPCKFNVSLVESLYGDCIGLKRKISLDFSYRISVILLLVTCLCLKWQFPA